MDDDLMYKLYTYIDLLQYYPDTETTRGVVASELESILNTKFGSKKASDLYRKMIKYRMSQSNRKE